MRKMLVRLNASFLLTIAVFSPPAAEAQPGGRTLTYELIKPRSSAVDEVELLDSLATEINERLGKRGVAEVTPERRIVVQLFGAIDDAGLADARHLIVTGIELQFRIVASPHMRAHDVVVRIAEEVTSRDVHLDNMEVARWVDADPREFPDEESARSRGLVTRAKNERFEVLVLTNDGLDITGESILFTNRAVDELGHPQLSFHFDKAGAQLFGMLTGQHLPTAEGDRYTLGLIVDGVLVSAMPIESKITSQGRISGGNMTDDDVAEMGELFLRAQIPIILREVQTKDR